MLQRKMNGRSGAVACNENPGLSYPDVPNKHRSKGGSKTASPDGSTRA
jgi:hypothetical protein